MDDRCAVLGRVAGSYNQAPLHSIVGAAWPEVQKYRAREQQEYLRAIDAGASAKLLTTDIAEMFRFAGQGQAEALYLVWDFSLDGKITWDRLKKYNNERQQTELTPSDLLSILIADVTRNGGKVVFLENGDLDQYGGIVLVRRF